MTFTASTRAPRRVRGAILTLLAVAVTVAACVLTIQSSAPSASTSSSGGGTFVLDEDDPAVSRLDSDLLGALREAVIDATADGVDIEVTSGWRSRQEQERLYSEAVETYGPEEAARRVATPGTSAHESGDAVDIGDADAARWLSERGAVYGLCQIYLNEPWHFELRPDALSRGCPHMWPNAAHTGRPPR